MQDRGAVRWWLAMLSSATLCLQGLVAGAAPAQERDAAPALSGADPALQRFDIPAQPLEDALYAFDVATGIAVFADGVSVAGRRSSAVTGTYAPVDALHAMLAGTGLAARTIGPRAITLATAESPGAATSTTYRGYSAVVQRAVVRALCADPDLRPGSYRIAAQLWLAPTGTIAAANLLSSSGSPDRDRRMHQALVGIAVGRVPPPALPQPVVMVILPRPARQSGDCS